MVRYRRFLTISGSVTLAMLASLALLYHGQRSSAVAGTAVSRQERSVATLTDLETAFERIAEQARPSVVSIQVEKRVAAPAMQMSPFGGDDSPFPQFFGFPRRFRMPQQQQDLRQRGAGSGFIVDAKGFVLTNNHVVDGADTITVALNDPKHTQLKAHVVGTDPRTDLAVLKVDSPTPLAAAKLGDSNQVRVGQWAVAIGNQLGEFDSTLTVGVVSATGRRLTDLGDDADYRDLIQTDAAINRGNSGGPLVNVRGEVIGINSAIASPNGGSVGLGFAIPVNTAKQVMDQLIAHGRVERGYLGVQITGLDDTLKKFYKVDGGALVQHVEAKGPAAAAGVQAEDVIVSVNGQKVEDADALRNTIGNLQPHSRASLGIVRDGKPMTLSVPLADLPANPSAGGRKVAPQTSDERDEHPRLGVSVRALTSDVRAQLEAPDSVRGAVVDSVAPGSPAERAGLQAGDIILRVGHTPVSGPADLRSALGKQDAVVLKVWHSGQERIVPVSLRQE